MRRVTSRAIPITVTISLLVAGCGSGGTTSSSQASSSGPTASASSSAIATWSSAFCTAFSPLATGFKSLDTKADTSTPELAVSSIVKMYTTVADVYGKAAVAMRKIGPPPAGSISAGIDGLDAVSTKFRALATATAAISLTDAAAVAAMENGSTDAFATLSSSIDNIDKGLPPEVVAGLGAAPECKIAG